VSSGTTSLDLLGALKGQFGKYYATDLYLRLPIRSAGGATYFYHPITGLPVIRCSDWLIVYGDVKGAIFPLKYFARRALSRAPSLDEGSVKYAEMIHPDLSVAAQCDGRIVLREYDLLQDWPYEKLDLIKMANILNAEYFTDDELTVILRNAFGALKDNGKLVITDNRDDERISVFSKQSGKGLVRERDVNHGAYAAGLASKLELPHQ
jgi:hypothetical protein